MNSENRIRVFLVEDEPKILKSQIRLLQNFREIEIVGSAMSGEEALELFPSLKPDVVLLDLGLPGLNGIEVTKALKKSGLKIEVLIFTIFNEEEKVLEAIMAGANGYILKGTPADKIVDAITEIYNGGSVIQPTLARSLLRHFSKPPATGTLPVEFPLTKREIETLELIAKGMSNKEVASILGVSPTTIRTHIEHIYQKLDVTNRTEAVCEGIRQGLIDI